MPGFKYVCKYVNKGGPGHYNLQMNPQTDKNKDGLRTQNLSVKPHLGKHLEYVACTTNET